MNSRDTVLSRIRNALSNRPEVELPPPPPVWPSTNPDSETMAKRFADELGLLSGEVLRCRSVAEAQKRVAALMADLDCSELAAVDRPLAREVTAELDSKSVAWASGDWNPKGMSEIRLGMVSAEYLLADTGSCVVECNNPQERLMCYLPPNCVIVARRSQLREHMPAAWKEIAARTSEPDRRGEFVVITGPSRTADIEKIIILGVHGPRRLFVLLVD